MPTEAFIEAAWRGQPSPVAQLVTLKLIAPSACLLALCACTTPPPAVPQQPFPTAPGSLLIRPQALRSLPSPEPSSATMPSAATGASS